MIYLTRSRLKDSTTVADLPAINKHIDEKTIPAIERIQGVRAARAYNSFHGDIVFIIDMEDAATLDRIIASSEVGQAIAPLSRWTVRVGPADLMLDRGPFQALYASR